MLAKVKEFADLIPPSHDEVKMARLMVMLIELTMKTFPTPTLERIGTAQFDEVSKAILSSPNKKLYAEC